LPRRSTKLAASAPVAELAAGAECHPRTPLRDTGWWELHRGKDCQPLAPAPTLRCRQCLRFATIAETWNRFLARSARLSERSRTSSAVVVTQLGVDQEHGIGRDAWLLCSASGSELIDDRVRRAAAVRLATASTPRTSRALPVSRPPPPLVQRCHIRSSPAQLRASVEGSVAVDHLAARGDDRHRQDGRA